LEDKWLRRLKCGTALTAKGIALITP